MAKFTVVNSGDANIVVLAGDPAADFAHTIHRLKPGETAEMESRGSPSEDELGVAQAVTVFEDGPWVDEEVAAMEAAEGHDGSLQ